MTKLRLEESALAAAAPRVEPLASTPDAGNSFQLRSRKAINWLLDHPWVLIPLLALPALMPFVTVGLTRSFDARTHLLRLAVLDRAILEGNLLPRWAPTMQLGLGYPVFNFYAPANYYLAQLLHLGGVSFYWSFIVALALPVLIGGFGMYLLASDLFGKRHWPALVAAVAYMYAPYLLVNMYIRGSLAETLAQAFLPWILWSFRRLWYTDHPIPWILMAATSLASLAVTHTITLLFAVPFLLGYLLVLWLQKKGKPHALWSSTIALAIAAGMSACFWLPLLAERGYLSKAAYATARYGWLPQNVWDWWNFLDPSLIFQYAFARPVPVGLVQLLAGIAGFFVAHRRDGEWLYLAAVAVFAAISAGRWALPLWTSIDVLTLTQFPWRLLSIISLPLALFAGGIVLRLPAGWKTITASLILALGLIATETPQLAQTPVFAQTAMSLSDAVLAHTEVDKGVFSKDDASSSVQEFRPRWATEMFLTSQAPLAGQGLASLVLSRANALDMEFTASNPTTTTLRFEDFYYPGWKVELDGGALPTFPSTSLGLLSVELPPGAHHIRKYWADTAVALSAEYLSLATLGLVALVVVFNRRWRWLAALPAMLAYIGIVAVFWPRSFQTVVTPNQPVAAHGVELAGFRLATGDPGGATIYPYWYVRSQPPGDLRMHWQILDMSGKILDENVTKPYFNTLSADNWPAGTIVDDAAQLPTPAGLPAGRYKLAVGLVTNSEELAAPPQAIGEFVLGSGVPANPRPEYPASASFGSAVKLNGYDVSAQVVPAPAGGSLFVVKAEDNVDLTLYWQPTESIDINYHGFVHLIDIAGRPIVKVDQLPGPDLSPPATWLPGRQYPDSYRLHIPSDVPSGLYWPLTGLYTLGDLQAQDGTVGVSSDYEPTRLLPIKVIGNVPVTPRQKLDVTYGGQIQLLGFDLEPAEPTLKPGAALTVTLYYKSAGAPGADLTRFLQLHNTESGLAAQYDSPPQDGQNPTWSWQPGEVVRDRVILRINNKAAPGAYSLLLGFYDTKAGGMRAPATFATGETLADSAAVLASVDIKP